VAETLENKISGSSPPARVVPSLVAVGSKLIMKSVSSITTRRRQTAWHDPARRIRPVLAADDPDGADVDRVFAVVWWSGMRSIVLILLSPWGGLDTALKGIRTGVLSLVAPRPTSTRSWARRCRRSSSWLAYFMSAGRSA